MNHKSSSCKKTSKFQGRNQVSSKKRAGIAMKTASSLLDSSSSDTNDSDDSTSSASEMSVTSKPRKKTASPSSSDSSSSSDNDSSSSDDEPSSSSDSSESSDSESSDSESSSDGDNYRKSKLKLAEKRKLTKPTEINVKPEGGQSNVTNSSRPLTSAEVRAILAKDDKKCAASSNWVRRSTRQPSRSAITSKNVKMMVDLLQMNDSDMVVLKCKKYINDPDTPCVIIDAILDALENNSNCQALYIQVG